MFTSTCCYNSIVSDKILAIANKDFTGLPTVIIFLSGELLGAVSCVNITIIDDKLVEEVESFSVKLSSDFPGVTVSQALTEIEISDNDGGI